MLRRRSCLYCLLMMKMLAGCVFAEDVVPRNRDSIKPKSQKEEHMNRDAKDEFSCLKYRIAIAAAINAAFSKAKKEHTDEKIFNQASATSAMVNPGPARDQWEKQIFEAVQRMGFMPFAFTCEGKPYRLQVKNYLQFLTCENHKEMIWRFSETAFIDEPPQPPDPSGDLMSSARQGDSRMVWESILLGADIEQRDRNGCTPLHMAARNVREDLAPVIILLSSGADINAFDNDHMTPLAWATEKGLLDVMELFLVFGARTDTRNLSCEMTPLDIAQSDKFSAGIELLKRTR